MRTTIDLPDPLFREIKTRSAQRGLKLKDFVTTLLQTGLAQTEASFSQPRTRSPLPVIRRATGALHPALSNREVEALLVAEDAGN